MLPVEKMCVPSDHLALKYIEFVSDNTDGTDDGCYPTDPDAIQPEEEVVEEPVDPGTGDGSEPLPPPEGASSGRVAREGA